MVDLNLQEDLLMMQMKTLCVNDLVMVLSDVGHGDLLGRVAIIPENNRVCTQSKSGTFETKRNGVSPNFYWYVSMHIKTILS